MLYKGGCHCGAVRFEFDAPERLECQDCNCSICRMTRYLHCIVPAAHFRLLSGEQALHTYQFNTGIARHLFCRTCGIKSFYVPRSNPDGYSVNVNCLDEMPENLVVTAFDGRNWESHAHALQHLSRA